MKEKLFNLFLFVMGDIIHEIGVVCRERAGNEAQKLTFLQLPVPDDFPAAKRYSVPDWYIRLPPCSMKAKKGYGRI